MNIEELNEILDTEQPVYIEQRDNQYYVYFSSVYDYIDHKEDFKTLDLSNVHVFPARSPKHHR